ncbi:MAG: FHA domain-containing protein [Gammaproteobacteria bacterium]|nr:FHA domain-containing protein [Gammaproteobacteria bacterium]
MNILDELKRQAEKILKNSEQATGKNQTLNEFQHSEVISGLDRIHHYLIELLEQLRIVDPEIRANFEIQHVGSLSDLIQKNYRLYTEDTLTQLTIGLSFILYCDNDKRTIQNFNIAIQDQLKTKLHHLGLEIAASDSETPEVKGHISSTLLFKSDYTKNLIFFTINNFENNISRSYEIEPDNIDNAFLNSLGCFLLGKNNQFIADINSLAQASKQIQSTVHQGDEPEPTLTEVMNTSLVNNLFRDRQQLYLTYRERIKELHSNDEHIVVGRSSKCSMLINSDCASRQHAQLVYRKGKFIISDHSTNGTFIKPQGGKEVYIHGEDYPLSGSGFISLGEAISVDNEHLIYYSCQ